MIPRAVGVGAGTKDFERHPNVLRLILGEDLARDSIQGSGVTAETREKAGDVSLGESNNETTKVGESLDSAVDGKKK